MKSSTKIIISILLAVLSVVCVAIFFASQNNVVLVVFNPITKEITNYKTSKKMSITQTVSVQQMDGYSFYGYFADDFLSQIDGDAAILSNSTIVLGYIKNISNLSEATDDVVGIKFEGTIDGDMSKLWNYSYLDLSAATLTTLSVESNNCTQTLILPAGNYSNLNNFYNLKKVVFSGSCELDNCFNYCPKLEEVCTDGIIKMQKSFCSCEKLKTIEISENLEDIQTSFINSPIEKFTNYSENFVVENGLLYKKAEGAFVLKNSISNLKNVVVNSQTKEIDEYAFYKSNLESITIDARVATIGEYAFAYSNLKVINILQNTVLEIDEYAFCGSNLQSANLGKGVREVSNYAFANTPITSINFDNSVLTDVGKYAFKNCENLTTVEFSGTQISLSEGAFCDCKNLQTVKNLNTKTLPEKLFENCSNLVYLTGLSGVETIKNYVFYNCASLSDISSLVSVEEIGIAAFENCATLAEVNFTKLTKISEKLFYNCKNLQSFVTTKQLELFSPTAFYECPKLETLEFLSGTFLQEDGVIYNADKTQILFCVPTINVSAFQILDSVKEINIYSLSCNKNIQNFVTTNSNFAVVDGVLFSADLSTLLCYPSGKLDKNYTINSQVKIIGKYAFANTQNLANLTIGENVEEIKNGFLGKNCSVVTLTTCFVGKSINDGETNFLGWFFGAEDYEQNGRYLSANLRYVEVTGQSTFNNGCFYDCANLYSVKLLNGSELTDYMFSNCYSLQTIDIANQITKIGAYSLYNCLNLTSLNLTYNDNLSQDDVAKTAFINTREKVEVYVRGIGGDSSKRDKFRSLFYEKRLSWVWKT